jgi:Ca-activated chloride channel family protein
LPCTAVAARQSSNLYFAWCALRDSSYTLWSYAIGHRVIAEPVIANGWIYAATADGYVVALEVGDRTLDGWHMFGGNPRHSGPVAAPPARPEGV